MSDVVVGDRLAVEQLSFTADGCRALSTHLGADVTCALDAGHPGVHAAADSRLTVLATWA